MRILKKQPEKFLFARRSRVATSRGKNHMVLIAVEGMNIDHALDRLVARWGHIPRADWEMLDKLEPEHFMGHMGDDYPMSVWERISRNLSPLQKARNYD
jgi:hypothetical protein